MAKFYQDISASGGTIRTHELREPRAYYGINKAIKSGVKTAIKKVDAAVVAKDAEAAKAALLNATSIIDKAATKGVYHKNNAARKVSRLTKAVNGIQ